MFTNFEKRCTCVPGAIMPHQSQYGFHPTKSQHEHDEVRSFTIQTTCSMAPLPIMHSLACLANHIVPYESLTNHDVLVFLFFLLGACSFGKVSRHRRP